MKIRTLVKMPVYGLAAYGAMTLWERYLSDWYAATYQSNGQHQQSVRDDVGASIPMEPDTAWVRVETTSLG